MGRSLNLAEKAQLRAMIARTSLAEVAKCVPCPQGRVLVSVSGGVAEVESQGCVEHDLIDFDNLEAEGLDQVQRQSQYDKLKRWLLTGKLEE